MQTRIVITIFCCCFSAAMVDVPLARRFVVKRFVVDSTNVDLFATVAPAIRVNRPNNYPADAALLSSQSPAERTRRRRIWSATNCACKCYFDILSNRLVTIARISRNYFTLLTFPGSPPTATTKKGRSTSVTWVRAHPVGNCATNPETVTTRVLSTAIRLWLSARFLIINQRPRGTE